MQIRLPVRSLARQPVTALGVLLWLSTSASAQTVTFFDGDFPDSDWKDTPVVTSAGDSFTTATVSNGGTPGAYRETNHVIASETTLRAAHVYLPAIYSPAAQGQIKSVAFTFAAKVISPAMVAYSLLVVQNNTYYSSPILVVKDQAWTLFATGPLTSASFTRISASGPGSPDFTCAGAPILFGFWTANSAHPAYTTDSGIDNWKVEVSSGPPCGGESACACDLDFKPAATLLLPYFEVDLSRSSGNDTVFVVNNALPNAVLANVVIWSDMGVPVMSFNLYLTGYDQQAFDLRTILVHGDFPQTGPLISPVGPLSAGGAFPNCDNLLPPPSIRPFFIDQVQRALTGMPLNRAGFCLSRNLGDNTARGYITIDTISQCTIGVPGDPGYFLAGGTGVATDVNALYGHYTYIDRRRGAAEGFSLVSIKANATDPATSSPGRYTFYGRFVGWTAIDNREPLATTFGADYVAGRGAFTDVIVWRDPKVPPAGFPCSSAPSWYPLGEEAVFMFDNQEHVLLTESAPMSPAAGGSGPPFPAATQRIRGIATLASAGWLLLDLNTQVAPAGSNPPVDPAAAQAWVTYVFPTLRLSTGYEAVRFDSACTALHLGVP